jgi:hypothetical protein
MIGTLCQVGLEQLIPVLRETVPENVTEPMPGNPTEQADPKQLAQLHAELTQAVALFKAPPKQSRDLAHPSVPLNATRKCFGVMPFGNAELQIVYYIAHVGSLAHSQHEWRNHGSKPALRP